MGREEPEAARRPETGCRGTEGESGLPDQRNFTHVLGNRPPPGGLLFYAQPGFEPKALVRAGSKKDTRMFALKEARHSG